MHEGDSCAAGRSRPVATVKIPLKKTSELGTGGGGEGPGRTPEVPCHELARTTVRNDEGAVPCSGSAAHPFDTDLTAGATRTATAERGATRTERYAAPAGAGLTATTTTRAGHRHAATHRAGRAARTGAVADTAAAVGGATRDARRAARHAHAAAALAGLPRIGAGAVADTSTAVGRAARGARGAARSAGATPAGAGLPRGAGAVADTAAAVGGATRDARRAVGRAGADATASRAALSRGTGARTEPAATVRGAAGHTRRAARCAAGARVARLPRGAGTVADTAAAVGSSAGRSGAAVGAAEGAAPVFTTRTWRATAAAIASADAGATAADLTRGAVDTGAGIHDATTGVAALAVGATHACAGVGFAAPEHAHLPFVAGRRALDEGHTPLGVGIAHVALGAAHALAGDVEAAGHARSVSAGLPVGALDAVAGVASGDALGHALLAVGARDPPRGAEATAAVGSAAGNPDRAMRATRAATASDAALARAAVGATAGVNATAVFTDLSGRAGDPTTGVGGASPVDARLAVRATDAHATIGRVARQVRREAVGALRRPCPQRDTLVVRRVAEGARGARDTPAGYVEAPWYTRSVDAGVVARTSDLCAGVGDAHAGGAAGGAARTHRRARAGIGDASAGDAHLTDGTLARAGAASTAGAIGRGAAIHGRVDDVASGRVDHHAVSARACVGAPCGV